MLDDIVNWDWDWMSQMGLHESRNAHNHEIAMLARLMQRNIDQARSRVNFDADFNQWKLSQQLKHQTATIDTGNAMGEVSTAQRWETKQLQITRHKF